ncbi:unnamed protein product [Eruca vesicaria subsp. sativa]|uniref:Uncharacterized protein n=1 Tax=Eruca vesicaria subsp. sativa TaxID=29727 RepID=A0ABC8M382_ERUVS|nr:unnamed protein product [Eruca vesicaria subsp. sativa]
MELVRIARGKIRSVGFHRTDDLLVTYSEDDSLRLFEIANAKTSEDNLPQETWHGSCLLTHHPSSLICSSLYNLDSTGSDYSCFNPIEERQEVVTEKNMQTELTKVREDFKMSESDCGSARVQVAQLTTKIKHISSALHKKDKHSQKGLFAMVQKWKKLLKYLMLYTLWLYNRSTKQTDCDSYCLFLSKLSLRNNPDYKF